MQYEIFRAGTRKDANGNIYTITAQDLQSAAHSYNTQKHEAPLVIGHPSHNAPAFGWVEKLSVKGDVLTADFAQVSDDLVDWVKQGHYKKVSASFYPPQHPNNPVQGQWYLRHVGFLGAMPPAVKGLQNVDFADDADDVILFCEDKDNSMTIEEQLAAEKVAREKAEQAAAQAQAQLAQWQAQQAQAQRDQDHQNHVDFAESLMEQGNVKPADKDLIVQVLDFATHPEHVTADFGEGQSLAGALKTFLQGLPPVIATGETAIAHRAASSPNPTLGAYAEFAEPHALSHHERALALAQKENISYEEAARRTAQ